MNDLAELIRPELALINQSFTSSTEAIEALGTLMMEGGFGKSTYLSAVLEREAKYPTGLLLETDGLNVAIPHADAEHVAIPAIAVATLSEPVDFQRMDKPEESIPVRLIFMLALTEPKAQLQTLSTLASAFQDSEQISQILAAKEAPELIAMISGGTR